MFCSTVLSVGELPVAHGSVSSLVGLFCVDGSKCVLSSFKCLSDQHSGVCVSSCAAMTTNEFHMFSEFFQEKGIFTVIVSFS